MENLSFSSKTVGWLAGEQIKEELEIVNETSITLEELTNMYDALINLTTSYYKQEKSKEAHDALVMIYSAKESLI